MHYKVKQVADMTGISVRMLHHYDKIGLLSPESVSPAGYRLYIDADLERLQQILFFKELQFSLQEIKEIIDSPSYDTQGALKAHKELLLKKKERLEEIIRTVDKTLNAVKGGKKMDKKEMFDAFDMSEIEKHQKKYAAEVKEKYPKEVVEESERKTSSYGKGDWASIQAESDEIYRRIVDAMDRGPGDPEVQKAIGDFRQHITQRFYTCTLEIFRGLGEMYVSDERFTAFYEKYRPGMAEFMKQAMDIYCENATE